MAGDGHRATTPTGRPSDGSGVKVGGHQASSASLVSIMTALWFDALRPEDRVSVKPHASPVLYAIQYLLGRLDAPRPRDPAGLRRPAELPEPHQGPRPGGLLDRVGGHRGDGHHLGGRRRPLPGQGGVGIRAAGTPDRAASATPSSTRAPSGRPSSTRRQRSSARSLWIVDLNRQSLDRVVPELHITRLMGMFESAGWEVRTLKCGRTAQRAVRPPGRRRPAAAPRRR